MSEWRKDPLVRRWTIIAPERAERPYALKEGEFLCPFCEGMESCTPKEVLSVRRPGTLPNQPGWLVRVFPNKYPALRKSIPLESREDNLYHSMSGFGIHEVIVETPRHAIDFAELPRDHLAKVLSVYRERLKSLGEEEGLRYGLLFKNQGMEAGASMSHAHSQIIATPIVPQAILEELWSSVEWYRKKGKCPFCELVERERETGERVVLSGNHFVVFIPYAARFPFEMMILPVEHSPSFLGEEHLGELAETLSRVLRGAREFLGTFSFNFVLHNVPYHTRKEEEESYHWHLEVLPTSLRVAGFEWGSGFAINVVRPEEAASKLRFFVESLEGE